MNMPYQSLYWRRACERCATLLPGIVIGLSGVQSAAALTGSTTLETTGLSPGVPGLDQVVGTREFRAGLVAFDQAEYVLARHHWAPMARLGHADSQFYMGLLHDVSVGIRPDARQAIRWYRLAAEQGVAEAQQKLALGFARGEGVEPDLQQAVRWWLRAARQGHANAQYNPGMIFAMGVTYCPRYSQGLALVASGRAGRRFHGAIQARSPVCEWKNRSAGLLSGPVLVAQIATQRSATGP